ncbi:aldehyde dehydrogenase (NADP(+)) [Pedobacter puniceum]|uniref:Aldehyde dehydrogenase family protein n=1 Tax=Pedobacter puniceum TaxID=2666136 RepID=A0A7K0FNB8_9SPHI|nr:aldehyde dehydrogenase (NADP(+)) [Pedobacter puniceum]MRX46915.1 aldehyde dehydrogenase family protein [Pedobacter puniceum]
MDITGKHLIASEFVAFSRNTFNASRAADESIIDIPFYEATKAEINAACTAAAFAFDTYKTKSGIEIAKFLETIAEEIVALGDVLIETAKAETGLPDARLNGERGRTTGQLNLFAKMLREGSWVNAIIDTAQPERKPLPKVDIRMMQVPIGPVAVFGASNFPFAFSVAGGDTVSALAAGCTVVFKAHPAHPATCELVATAIHKAIIKCDMPAGVFNMVQGASHETGAELVTHPLIQAVGFTGSFKGGKALYDLATRREQPIPVYAEMGSVNPVFFLPGILKEKGDGLAKSLAESVTLGVGQFCTNPGMFIVEQSKDAEAFVEKTRNELASISVGPMLTSNIKNAFLSGVNKIKQTVGVNCLTNAVEGKLSPYLFTSNVAQVLANEEIAEEVFGPSTVGVYANNIEEVLEFARKLKGHLTATIFGTEEDLLKYRELIHILQEKVGRLIFNNFPTGVEVTHAMVHGGPYPATTDSRSTSVGTTAIYRFTRPICFQNCPEELLPKVLKESNPSGIIRTINGITAKH